MRKIVMFLPIASNEEKKDAKAVEYSFKKVGPANIWLVRLRLVKNAWNKSR